MLDLLVCVMVCAEDQHEPHPDAPVPSSAPQSDQESKDRLHHMFLTEGAALSVAVDVERAHLFVGLESGLIAVWDLSSYQMYANMMGHAESVLALQFHEPYLFSASCMFSQLTTADGTVRVWDAATLAPLAIVYPTSENAGDIFSRTSFSLPQSLGMPTIARCTLGARTRRSSGLPLRLMASRTRLSMCDPCASTSFLTHAHGSGPVRLGAHQVRF